MTVTRSLLQALKNHGARAIFGIPGDYALAMFDEIERSEILPLVTLSHEPALSFAADAAARVAGGVGVAACTYGPGAFNLLNGTAGAYAERSPLVVVSAAPARAARSPGYGVHHQVRALDSQSRIFSEVTCAQAILDDAEKAPDLIARTLGACVTQSLPVYIEMPSDVAASPCEATSAISRAKADPEAVSECAAEIAALIRVAKSPVIMVDVEVRRFGLESAVGALARLTNIPLVSSFMGRGVASAKPSPAIGSYLGLAGDPEITRLVEESDALILLGVILSDTNLGVAAQRLDPRRVVHALGGEVRIAHHVYPNIPLRDLIAAFMDQTFPVRETVTRLPAGEQRRFVWDDSALEPSDVAPAINALFARHGAMPLACDVGDSLFVSLEVEYGDVVAQAYYASMGFAVPAAIGIQAASGKRPFVLVGDGAFQMTGWELGNCQRYGFDPIVVVLNNCSWEMLRTFAPQARFNDLSDWHFADIAGSLGGVGQRVHTRAQLARALERAWEQRGRFHLIEVILERGATSDGLRRFVEALQRKPTR